MIHQGEGVSLDRWADESHQELTHYHKFKLIVDAGVPDAAIHPCLVNPKRAMLPDRLHDPVDLFNGLYRHLLVTMGEIYSGTADQAALVRSLYLNMVGLLGPLGRFLAAHPIGNAMTAGPTFEVYEFRSSDHVGELVDLAHRTATGFPELGAIAAGVASLTVD